MQTLTQFPITTQGPIANDRQTALENMSLCICPACRMRIAIPPHAAVPTKPLVCPLNTRWSHMVWCASCSNIVAILYYYQRRQKPEIHHPIFSGVRLAVYVELERLGATQTETVTVPIATLARTIGATYGATYKALHRLTRAGYVQDITLSNPRRHEYAVLVHQLPKGE